MAVAKLSDIISDDDLRILLGLSEKEYGPSRIDTPIYFATVKTSLRRIDPRIWERFAQIDGKPEGDRTSSEARFYDAVVTYVSWRSASLLSNTMPSLAVKSLTDGKAGFTRDTSSMVSMPDRILQELAIAEAELIEAARALFGEETPVTAFVGIATATPGAFNPITG